MINWMKSCANREMASWRKTKNCNCDSSLNPMPYARIPSLY